MASGLRKPRWLAVAPDGTVYIAAHRLLGPDGNQFGSSAQVVMPAGVGPGSMVVVTAGGVSAGQAVAILSLTRLDPIVPHTVVRTPRTCESCHANPRALGLGLFTTKEPPKLSEFQQPLDFRWDRIVDEEGRPLQATTVDGARPLTREEMDRIRNAPYKLPAGTTNGGVKR